MSHLDHILWQASEERLQASAIWKFKSYCEQKTGLHFFDYDALHKWSISAIPDFWRAATDFLEIRWTRLPDRDWLAPPPGKMRGAQWFPGGRLSFAANLLPARDVGEPKIISIIEGLAEPVVLTSQDLLQQVAACTAALRAQGVSMGDRVAAICPNTSEAVIAMLAVSAIGAVWSSCSPDFGCAGIIDRFEQIEPKLLFATRAYQYNGKLIDCIETIKGVQQGLPSLKTCVMIDPLNFAKLPASAISWQDFLEPYNSVAVMQDFHPVDTAFDHPLLILFSSGTTGKPKCIVHSVGGTLLQHKKELMLHSDLGPGDRLLYFTTCGWMMWNWMLSALSTGAGLVLFEGSILRDDMRVLWKTIQDYDVTCFGTSPKYLSACMKAELRPLLELQIPKLRTILSTGSPLMPEHYHWVYSSVKADLHLASISGGTDIVSCFMLGNPWRAVYAGEIQAPGLGMALDCWDEAGTSLRGQRGELVCTQPFPAMPLGFWHDDGSKYQQAYFNFYPHIEVWRHGDFIEITDHGGIIVHGRSDAILNPGGIRIGTAEIYGQLEKSPVVLDSLAVSYVRQGDAEMLLMVKLKEGVKLNSELIQQLNRLLRLGLSPRHVPAAIFQVQDIPYTRSGKKLEIAVTRILAGEALDNLSAIANPECLSEYEHLYQSLRNS
ncbi:MAG: acetoacetate--CoA ligase [Proteobacteria bacterium]|nr:acetoacetate--CoA ligase [Pseudomonadota bacterium]